jgi:urea transport system substrate-binding protein
MAAVAVTYFGGLIAGLAIVTIAAVLAAFAVERPLKQIVATIGKVAAGDAYAKMPKHRGRLLDQLSAAGESLRDALIAADVSMAEQRRREAEAKLHYAGRTSSPAAFVKLLTR